MTTLRTTIAQCAYCNSPTPEKVIADRLIRSLPENVMFGGKLRIVECRACGLRYLNPTPDVRDLHHIYNYDVYEDSTNNNPVLMEHFYEKLRAHAPSLERVIEIGCGTGDYLAWLQHKGVANVEGVEFADSANRVKYRGPLHVGRMEDLTLPDATYDAVLLLNVIEHLSDPQAVLTKICRMLKPGGVLLLRHPNSDLFFFRPYWLLVEVPKYLMHRRLLKRGKPTRFTIVGFQHQHLFYFRRRSVSLMLERAGLIVEEFSTADPYNRLRISKSLKHGKLIEAGIASVRHALGAIGLGPECLIVARPRTLNVSAGRVTVTSDRGTTSGQQIERPLQLRIFSGGVRQVERQFDVGCDADTFRRLPTTRASATARKSSEPSLKQKG